MMHSPEFIITDPSWLSHLINAAHTFSSCLSTSSLTKKKNKKTQTFETRVPSLPLSSRGRVKLNESIH